MGTHYNVTIVSPPSHITRDQLQQTIDSVLKRVNQQMSTYIDDSEISRFNQAPVGEWFSVSAETLQVVNAAQSLSQLSAGAFDITVGPLIELWGFGRKITSTPPADDAIMRLLDRIGWRYLLVNDATTSLKKERPITINLSAIAKGYGVDAVAQQLDKLSIAHYLVEVGGEIRVKGQNGSSQPWRIGIETPSLNHQGAQRAIALGDSAVATSGDYRNFYEHEGKRYSHTIDPKTGKPVTHQLASVTVITDTAMMADGLATLFNVVGYQQALAIAEKNQIAVYLIGYNGDSYDIHYSSAFAPYLDQDITQ